MNACSSYEENEIHFQCGMSILYGRTTPKHTNTHTKMAFVCPVDMNYSIK